MCQEIPDRQECVTQNFCKLVHAAHDEKFDGLKGEVRDIKDEMKAGFSKLEGILIGNGKPGHGQRISRLEEKQSDLQITQNENKGLGKYAVVMLMVLLGALGVGAFVGNVLIK